MSDLDSLLQKIENLRRAKKAGTYAPHKPLLLLQALGELSRGNETVSFSDVSDSVTGLLKTFGPNTRVYHPEYPFWRLQNDDLWVVTTDETVRPNKSGDVLRSDLLRQNAKGEFLPEDLQALTSNPRNIGRVAKTILEDYFPSSLHEDILYAVGLNFVPWRRNNVRNPDFRRNVLRAYESQCCVCGFDVRLGDSLALLEAAHIKWRAEGGPDEESNGLALCVFHHKAFDMGAFTVDHGDGTIVCSQELSGSTTSDWLTGYHGKKMREPQSQSYLPEKKYLDWHRTTIFKGPGRDY